MDGKVTITILGASVRAAACSAVGAGLLPYGIDLFADEDLRALCPATQIARYPTEFLRALAAAPDSPWVYTGGLENHPPLLTRLAALRPLWGNGADVCRRIRDPGVLQGILRSADFLTPQFWSPAAVSQMAGPREAGVYVVKPLRGSGGLGVRFARESDWHRLPPATILQQYMEGEAASAVYIAAGGEATLLGTTRQILGRDVGLSTDFAYAGNIAPLTISLAEQQTLQRLGGVLTRDFGLVGLFGVDWVRTGRGVAVIEVNPRYTASVEVVERCLRLPLFAWHVAACCDGRLLAGPLRPENGDNDHFAGKLIVYARRPVVIPQGSLGDDLADIPAAGQTIESGQPIATVFAAGSCHSEVFDRLLARAEALHRNLELST
jgi:predicted ATP-grasp superfamily ATP-dependent carboligase